MTAAFRTRLIDLAKEAIKQVETASPHDDGYFMAKGFNDLYFELGGTKNLPLMTDRQFTLYIAALVIKASE
jgi:hypothetical protein